MEGEGGPGGLRRVGELGEVEGLGCCRSQAVAARKLLTLESSGVLSWAIDVNFRRALSAAQPRLVHVRLAAPSHVPAASCAPLCSAGRPPCPGHGSPAAGGGAELPGVLQLCH